MATSQHSHTFKEALAKILASDSSGSDYDDSDVDMDYVPSDGESTTDQRRPGFDPEAADTPKAVDAEIETADAPEAADAPKAADAEIEDANAPEADTPPEPADAPEAADAEIEDADAPEADDAPEPADSPEPAVAQTENADQPNVRRRKRPAPQKWQCNIIKDKRLQGEAFKNRKGHDRPAAEMGPPCNSEFCKKSNLRSCQTLDAEQRKDIFERFWSMKSWEERRLLVHSLVNKVDIKQKKNPGSRRNTSFSYHLKLSDATSIPVCKSLFSSTLGLSKRTVVSWLKDVNYKPPQQPKTPKSGKCVPVGDDDLKFLKAWLNGLPSLPSHYCRNTPTYAMKKFLYPGTTKASLYSEYCQTATAASCRVVGSKIFSKVFDEANLSVFVPRKDQCDICVSAKHGNIDQAKHESHLKQKEEARTQKQKDKEAAAVSNNKLSVWTMDLQAVMLCPKTKASSLYYKTKLQVHNFTLYNLTTKEGYCYTWDETEATLNSEVFAHLLVEHFGKIVDSNPATETIIIWSDGCGYQNRNTVVSNALLHLATTRKVTILQKYLVSGHTQMECDSMHSTIERKLNACEIITPHDYTIIFQSARIRPSPYHVSQVYHHSILALNGSYVTSIRPGKRAGDPTVHDLRALKYDSSKIYYKLGFTEDFDWETLPQRISIPREPFEWVRFFDSRLPINARKYRDLQAMKHVLPQHSHAFFDTLPYQEA